MNIFDLFKKPVTQPLPSYPLIDLNAIPPASILLFYGGTKVTELVGSRLYKHPYTPPAFHAAFYCKDGLMLNVGSFRTIKPVKDEYRSTRRVDVITVKNLLDSERQKLVDFAFEDTSKMDSAFELSDYSLWDFVRFGLPFMKASKKQFCSENVSLIFKQAGIQVADQAPEDTAPWDLYEHALAHPEQFEIRTLWLGTEFKK